jgi:hypothetical protein
MKKRKRRHGLSGSGPKGLKTASGKCRFGKAKSGKRKGQCLKHKRAKR